MHAPVEELGVIGARGNAIRTIAQKVLDNEIDLDVSDGIDSFVKQMIQLPGVGPWTAQYIAMRALGEPDAFPSGDLGLRKGASPKGEAPMAEKDLIAMAEPWRPWRAYGAMYLWLNAADE